MEPPFPSRPGRPDSAGDRNPWNPGAIARLPWQGIGALLIALLGVGAAIGVLVVSNGQPISSWRVQPTVYLAIASTVTNISLHFALSEGVVAAWWTKALKPGTRLGDLHRIWAFGNNLVPAITGLRYFNLAALACILVALAPINGPLLQRASTVTVTSVVSIRELTVPVVPSLTTETGYRATRGDTVAAFLSANFSRIAQDYYAGRPINTTGTGCGPSGRCTARLRGAGFSVSCSSHAVPYILTPGSTGNTSNDPATVGGTNPFMTFYSWNPAEPNAVRIGVQFKATSDCDGNLTVHNCTLTPAIVDYPVIIDGNTSTITLDPSSTIFDDTVESPSTWADGREPQGTMILGGFWYALNSRFSSSSEMWWTGSRGYEFRSEGFMIQQYVNISAATDLAFGTFDPVELCHINFRDPMDDLLQEARDLMFRTAMATANSSHAQTVLSSETETMPIYESHWEFLAIAVSFSVIAVVVVAGLFHGYWHLGRSVTLSPIETAKAFDAPLLRGEDPNGLVETLVTRAGDKEVRYGEIDGVYEGTSAKGGMMMYGMNNRDGGRLKISDNLVRAPRKGYTYS